MNVAFVLLKPTLLFRSHFTAHQRVNTNHIHTTAEKHHSCSHIHHYTKQPFISSAFKQCRNISVCLS